MSAALVGPLPTVTFHGGPRRSRPFTHEPYPTVAYDVPEDTLDPRYVLCTDHHVACDCREAEFAENARESRVEWAQLREVLAEVIGGHPTWVEDKDGTELPGCACTACQVVRKVGAHLLPMETVLRENTVVSRRAAL